jgi:hypothetical protein
MQRPCSADRMFCAARLIPKTGAPHPAAASLPEIAEHLRRCCIGKA